MEFNSWEFGIFFIIFYILYWFVFNHKLKSQNLLILAGSYFFYAWWDWRFLSLLIGSSIINYFLGIYIYESKNEKTKSRLLYIGLFQGLSFLFFFKYYNFFIDSFINSFINSFGVFNLNTLKIILPLGISFYTFRTISYLLDVHNEKIKPTKDWVVFFSYVAFFPSLIAGPIDRAGGLIPQLENKRTLQYSEGVDGLRQILWGLFKKIVIANSCSVITDSIFDNYQTLPASTLVFGSFLYCIQGYSDFSGYSDMAIGFSRLLGFNVAKNFNFPFFSQNIAEFWQKWHISFTSFMTEYVFTPLSFIFRRLGKSGVIIAVLLNFLLIGIWHGDRLTYILFGFLHGCYFIPLIINGRLNRKSSTLENNNMPTIKQFFNMVKTFILVMLTMVIFKFETISEAFYFYKSMIATSLFSIPILNSSRIEALILVLFILFMIIFEWFGRNQEHAMANLEYKMPKLARWTFYYVIILTILCYSGSQYQFIYAQF